MSVPALRFPEFEGEWEEKRLGEFLTFKNGVNADKSKYGHGRKFINVMDIIADQPILSENIIGSVSISDKEFEKNEVVYGDILFQRSSETREETGQSNVYLDRVASATFGGFVIRGRPIVEFDPRYFDALLQTDKARKDVTTRSGGSTRFNVGQESLSAVVVNVAPSLPEQKKIAAFLGVVDAKIASLRERVAGLERYKRWLMQALFSQTLRFTKPDGSAFPDWDYKPLGEIFGYEQPTKYLVSSTDYSDDNEIPVLTAGQTFVLGYTSETHGIFDAPLPVVIFDDFTTASKYVNFRFKAKSSAMKILRLRNPELPPKLFFELLRNVEFRVGDHRRHWISEFQFIEVPFPHPDEQAKIAEALQGMDAKIAAVTDQLARMQDFKKGLLQQMFV